MFCRQRLFWQIPSYGGNSILTACTRFDVPAMKLCVKRVMSIVL